MDVKMTKALILICVMTINQETQIPLILLVRMIEIESGFDPKMISKNRNGSFDIGLMQLNSRYLMEFSRLYFHGRPFDATNPVSNLKIGMRKLARLKELTGSWEGAVLAYNAGLKQFRTGHIPYSTRDYFSFIFGR